jgi:UDP-GlcNAc:undecaprenyl-phosphate/decaprenyl-phosphate GlcNAc-1-phosphate transferase
MLSLNTTICLLVAAVLGMLSTYVLRGVARRLGWLDHPNPIVPQHREPVARPGGLAIAVASGSTLGMMSLARHWGLFPSLDGSLRLSAHIAIPASLFLLLGLLDDRLRLQPPVKLTLQVVCASIAVRSGIIATLSGNGPLDAFLSCLWIVTLVNAFNLIDVCDGLLAGLTVLVLVFWSYLHGEHAAVGLAVGGACLGFLVFNRPPASVFLGDSGSHFLGFVVAALLIETPRSSTTWTTIASAMLVAGVPLFELLFVTLVRLRKGLPWWRGSPDHLALRLQAAGLSRVQTDLVIWTVTAILLTAALLFDHLGLGVQLVLLGGVVAGLYLWGRWLWRWEVRRT